MIQPVSFNSPVYFKNKTSSKHVQNESNSNLDKNPVSRTGEVMKLMTATFVGGLAVAGKLILELADGGDFLIEIFADKATKATSKGEPIDHKKILTEANLEIKDKKILRTIGAFTAIVVAFFAGFALLYTAFHAPKIAYESKVNTFKKSKEMDVYVKANEAEKELYTQLDEQAQNSSGEDKAQLKEQYLKLKNAKNQTPDYVKLKLK